MKIERRNVSLVESTYAYIGCASDEKKQRTLKINFKKTLIKNKVDKYVCI